MPLLLTGVVASALALTACAGAPPAGPVAQTSPQPALAVTTAVIPAAARQVTLSMNYGANANGRKPPAPVTITGSVKVSEIAGLVADQPPWPPGTYNCPASDGTALILTFRAHPGRPSLAAAFLELNGCEGTDLTVGTKAVVLGHPNSARSLAAKVLEVVGVPWKLPPAYWPPASRGSIPANHLPS